MKTRSRCHALRIEHHRSRVAMCTHFGEGQGRSRFVVAVFAADLRVLDVRHFGPRTFAARGVPRVPSPVWPRGGIARPRRPRCSREVPVRPRSTIVKFVLAQLGTGLLGSPQPSSATAPPARSADGVAIRALPGDTVDLNGSAELTVTDVGAIGYSDPDGTERGLGFRLAGGMRALYHAGVVLGVSPGQVSDAAYGSDDKRGHDSLRLCRDVTTAVGDERGGDPVYIRRLPVPGSSRRLDSPGREPDPRSGRRRS